MEGNIHNHPTKISWEHCFFCRKKHTEGLKTCKKLENLANNSSSTMQNSTGNAVKDSVIEKCKDP